MKSKNVLGGLSIAVILHLDAIACSAQTNIYLFSGSETNITLNPGTYIITAYGAMGGTLNRKLYGGLGAEMSAEFNFSTSTALTLLVGGGGSSAYYGGGGGGGSFVVEGRTPLVIAGGGGGGGDLFEGANGNVSANGSSSTFFPVGSPAPGSQVGNSGFGGTNGGGGAGGFALYYGPGSTISLSGGGGGGFLGNGGGGDTGDGVITNGGGSFESGGYGGSAGSGYPCPGGYGGGGGGGGGYSGGGGGNVYGYTGGGGGGSIIDSSAITNLAEISDIASPDDPTNGEIIITPVPTPVAIITSAALGFTNGMFGFDVIGPSGSNVVIQASTDLQTWIPLQTNLLGSGPLHFSDAQSPANFQRFYRVQLLP